MKLKVHAITQSFNGFSPIIVSDVTASNETNPTKIKTLKTKALWDTGATNTCITKNAAKKLGLKPISKTKVKGVHTECIVNVYAITLTLNNENVRINARVTELQSISADSSINILIGMDVILLGDFCITNFQKKTVMTFRVPSIKCIDFCKDLKKK